MGSVIDWFASMFSFFSTAWGWLNTSLFTLDLSWLSALGIHIPPELSGGLSVTPLGLSCTTLIFGVVLVGIVKTFVKWW